MAARPVRRQSGDTTGRVGQTITIRQVRFLINIVGREHRAVKRITRPRLGCSLRGRARSPGRHWADAHDPHRPTDKWSQTGAYRAEQFSSPAASSPVQQGSLHPHLLPPLLSLVLEDEAHAWSRKRCRRLRSAMSGTQSRQILGFGEGGDPLVERIA